jgi:hypothetical protein
MLLFRSRASYILTDGQSASSPWCRAPFGADDLIFYISLSDNYFLSSSCGSPSLTRGRGCNLQCNYSSSCKLFSQLAKCL